MIYHPESSSNPLICYMQVSVNGKVKFDSRAKLMQSKSKQCRTVQVFSAGDKLDSRYESAVIKHSLPND